MDFRVVDSPFFDKEGKGSSDAEPEADGLRSRVPDQVYIGELDEVKNDCLFSMIVDTRGGGERRGTTGACWLTWCRQASGRQSRRHLPGKPSRDGNALTREKA
jgi:hypothetical protein